MYVLYSFHWVMIYLTSHQVILNSFYWAGGSTHNWDLHIVIYKKCLVSLAFPFTRVSGANQITQPCLFQTRRSMLGEKPPWIMLIFFSLTPWKLKLWIMLNSFHKVNTILQRKVHRPIVKGSDNNQSHHSSGDYHWLCFPIK